MSNNYKDATVYLQIEPEWYHIGARATLTGAKPVRMTRTKPSRPVGGTVLVKLILRIPDAAFLPLQPEAVVVLPDDAFQMVQVEAQPPTADGDRHD